MDQNYSWWFTPILLVMCLPERLRGAPHGDRGHARPGGYGGYRGHPRVRVLLRDIIQDHQGDVQEVPVNKKLIWKCDCDLIIVKKFLVNKTVVQIIGYQYCSLSSRYFRLFFISELCVSEPRFVLALD